MADVTNVYAGFSPVMARPTRGAGSGCTRVAALVDGTQVSVACVQAWIVTGEGETLAAVPMVISGGRLTPAEYSDWYAALVAAHAPAEVTLQLGSA